MDGMIYTKHFRLRSQQRCIKNPVVEALLRYGERHSPGYGSERVVFTKKALVEIRNEVGPSIFKMCEKVRNAYIIVSKDGVLITVARDHRRTVH